MKPRQLLIALMLSASISAFGLRSTTSSALQLPEQPTIEQLQKVNQDMIREVEILNQENENQKKQLDDLKDDLRDYHEENWRADFQYNVIFKACIALLSVFCVIVFLALFLLAKHVYKLKTSNLELKDKLAILSDKLLLFRDQILTQLESINESDLFSQALSEKDPILAIEKYSRLISNNPSPLLLNNRAIEKIKIGDMRGALNDLDQAIDLNPSDTRAYTNRGALLAERESFDSAMHDFSEAIRLNPNSPTAYMNRAKLLASKGRNPEAMHDIKRAFELISKDTSEGYFQDLLKLLLFSEKSSENMHRFFTDYLDVLKSKPYLSIIATKRGGRRQSNEQDGEEDYISPLGEFNQIISLK